MQRDVDRLQQRNVDELIGICAGIAADGVVNQEEATFILSWLEANRSAATCFPGDVLVSRLHDMLVDETLDDEEAKELLDLMRQSSGRQVSPRTPTPAANLPFDDPAPAVDFAGCNFVFSGIFAFGPRAACEKAVRMRDGEAHPKVTERTHYVVVGSAANPEWKHASFGTKILRAIEIKKSGVPLALITEDHWAEAIVNTPETTVLEMSIKEYNADDLKGKRFVFTGTLYGLSRYAARQCVEELGGHVVSSVFRNLDYLVYGYEPGPKLERAIALGVKTLNQDEFFRIIKHNEAVTQSPSVQGDDKWLDALLLGDSPTEDNEQEQALEIVEVPGIAGKYFTFTGYLHGISRIDAEKRVRQAGGYVEYSVTKSRTDYVVANTISRTESSRATKWGKPIIGGKELLAMLKGGS